MAICVIYITNIFLFPNCKSYFKSYPNIGEAFECGCNNKNMCPKDYNCIGGVCVKNTLIKNEFKKT